MYRLLYKIDMLAMDRSPKDRGSFSLPLSFLVFYFQSFLLFLKQDVEI